MRNVYGVLLILPIMAGCSTGGTEERLPSPGGDYILEIQVGDRANPKESDVLVLLLTDKSGKELDYLNTRVLEDARWAAIWANDSTVLLGTEDTGARAWVLTRERKFREVPSTDRLTREGVRVLRGKYGQ